MASSGSTPKWVLAIGAVLLAGAGFFVWTQKSEELGFAKPYQVVVVPNLEGIPRLGPGQRQFTAADEVVGESSTALQAEPPVQYAESPARIEEEAGQMAAAPIVEAPEPSAAAPIADEAPEPLAVAPVGEEVREPAAAPEPEVAAVVDPPAVEEAPAAVPQEIPAVAAAPAPAAVSPSFGTGSSSGPYDLEITATARQVWVWISVDDGPLRAVSLDQGESASFQAEEGYVLTVDDAGGVDAKLNGRELPSFGEPARARRDIVIPSDQVG